MCRGKFKLIQTQTYTRRSELSRGALLILDAAESLFAAKDFDAVSINEIARHAQTSKANIYHHFKSKEVLYISVLKNACERSVSALNEVNSQLSDDPLKQLNQFFAGHLQAILSSPLSTRLIQRELLENGEQKGKLLAEEVFSDTFANVVRLVKQAQDKGMIRQGIDPSLLAFLMFGANVVFFESRSVLKHLPDVNFTESPEEYSLAIFDLLTHGFK